MNTSLKSWKSLVAVMMAVGLAVAIACGGGTTAEAPKAPQQPEEPQQPAMAATAAPAMPAATAMAAEPAATARPAATAVPRAQVSWRYPHPPPEPRRYLQSRLTCRNPRVRRARSPLSCRTLAPALDCTGPAVARAPFAGAQRRGCSKIPTTGKDRFSANRGLLRIGRWRPTLPT